MLTIYHQRFPNVDLDVQTGSSVQLLSALQTGSLDLALVVAPDAMEEPTLKAVLEQVTEIVLVSRLADAPRRGPLTRLKELPFVLFRKGARIENLIDRYLAEHEVVPDVVMRFDSAEALKSIVMTGIGVSMLPLYTVDEDIRTGRLNRIRQKEPPLLVKIHLVARVAGYHCCPANAQVKAGK